jgi:hypothetical protein
MVPVAMPRLDTWQCKGNTNPGGAAPNSEPSLSAIWRPDRRRHDSRSVAPRHGRDPRATLIRLAVLG